MPPPPTLARHAARELLYRAELPGNEVDEVVVGQVVPSPVIPNVAREVSLLPQLPRTIPAYSLNRACASGAQAITNAADQIMLRPRRRGARRRRRTPLRRPDPALEALQPDARRREQGPSLAERLAMFAKVRPRDLAPVAPAIAEPSTGESMGQSAERMAKENGITRDAQDQLALMSHQRAAAGTADGRLTAEIAPWFGGADLSEVTTSRQRHPAGHLAGGTRRS